MKKLIFLFVLFTTLASSEVVKNIEISGNKRIANETIIMFGNIEIDVDYNDQKINKILKNLYKTDFFENVSITLKNNILKIKIIENPIIQSIDIKGIKNKRILEVLNENLILKQKNSFIESKVKKDEINLKNILKSNGYYFSEINTKIKKNDNNTIDLIYDIELGEKAYIEKIKFIGDKKIKDRKLKSVIVSEESKFWKFISNKKFLDKRRIKLDENLLKNYYKNNGYFNVLVNSTTALILDNNKFELIFNINAGNKYIFNEINLEIPQSFDEKNFSGINKKISKLKGDIYSLNKINKILEEIDKVTLSRQYEFIKASFVEKTIDDNKINLNIILSESEKLYVEKINILGNYLTNENVIRNSLIIDEGDPFNEILFKKSINRLKSKNIFGKVDTSVNDGSSEQTKIVDIIVEEQPTGEIAAAAGTGTSGSQVSFSIAENNYLGKGIKLRASTTISDNSLEFLFSRTDPNFKNSSNSLTTTIENSSEDLMNKFGYKTDKTGFSFGTSFEQFEDVFFSPSISTYYETLETSSKATTAKKKQEGDYFDTNLSYSLVLNRLNQNFQPSDGFKSKFSQTIPIVADDKSIINSYELSKYSKIGENSVFSFIFFARAVNSFDDDVRVSKRIYIPSRKLRGFASGKIGPKDGADYIGGNYGAAINLAATLPQFFGELQNVDFSVFFDSANLYGVDYDSSLDSNKIRSSTGLAIDWFTPIGPLSFSFATPLTKADSDTTETFRFKIGTTF